MNKYKVIYADCPWDYENSNGPAFGGATYPTMSVEELKSLSIGQIADKDCVLFFWATFPKLREALEIIEAWGFQYRTNAFTWVKINPKSETLYSGLGYWTNQNSEICLLAKKGHPKRVAKNVKQIIMAPRGRHSEKPAEVRDRIVQLMGNVPRIELFARKRVPGWDALGLDLDGLDIRKSIHLINICQLMGVA